MARKKKEWTAAGYRNFSIYCLVATVLFTVMGFMRSNGFTSLYDYIPFMLAAAFFIYFFVCIYYYIKLKKRE